MKLRLGWGITGQQEIPVGDFYLERYNIGDPNSQYYFANLPYPGASDVTLTAVSASSVCNDSERIIK